MALRAVRSASTSVSSCMCVFSTPSLSSRTTSRGGFWCAKRSSRLNRGEFGKILGPVCGGTKLARSELFTIPVLWCAILMALFVRCSKTSSDSEVRCHFRSSAQGADKLQSRDWLSVSKGHGNGIGDGEYSNSTEAAPEWGSRTSQITTQEIRSLPSA